MAAVTINAGSNRLFPQLVHEPGPKTIQPPRVPEPAPVAPYLTFQNGILRAGNTYVAMTVDAGSAFSVRQFDNKWLGADAIALAPAPGFEVTLENRKVDPRDLQLLHVSDVAGSRAKTISLTYGLPGDPRGLEFNIEVSVSREPEIGMPGGAAATEWLCHGIIPHRGDD